MDIAAWLHSLGMQQYDQAFRDNAIDAAILPELTAALLSQWFSTAVVTAASASRLAKPLMLKNDERGCACLSEREFLKWRRLWSVSCRLGGSHPARNRKFADSPLEETVSVKIPC